MAVINITSNNFANFVLKAPRPTLVLFWAMGTPHSAGWDQLFHELDAEGADVGLCKVSVNYAPHLALRFHIATYPTVALFRDGALAGTVGGAAAREKIEGLLGQAGAEQA